MGEKIRQLVQQQWAGLIALFLVLSGGTALANHGFPNTISSEDIIDAEVKQPDLAPNSVGTGKIIDGIVRSGDVADDTTDFGLTAQDLEPGSVGTSEVADASLTGTDVADNALTGADIAGKSILTDDIGFATITGANISDGSITGSDVASSSLTGSDIAPGSLTGSDIANTNSIGGAEIDESDLDISSLVFARDEGPTLGQCDGLLSSSQEVCADVLVTLSLPSEVFIVASGGWSKQLGDPAESLCRISVDDQDPPEALLFMGENTGFGGGHSAPRRAMPFTLNATTGRLDAGIHQIALICEDNSSGDQDTLIGNARISALVVAD